MHQIQFKAISNIFFIFLDKFNITKENDYNLNYINQINNLYLMKSGIVIIGSGHSGGMAASLLRQKKFSGPITIIGKESYLPYQRPALSKSFLLGDLKKENLYLKSEKYYEKNNISIIKDTSVIKIEKEQKSLLLDNGKTQLYSTLIIATGSKLKTIKTSQSINDLFYLKTIEDSLKLRSSLNRKKSIGIIGSGYIGLEIAAAAIKKNLNVFIIEHENRVMSRTSTKQVASFFKSKHKKMGVNFIFNRSASDIQKKGSTKSIILSDNRIIDTDIVAIGIGVEPNIDLAKNSGIKCNDGIVVDENCLTSDQHILAIGDCTNHPNAIYKSRMRLESVHNAVEQSKTAVNFIISKPSPYNQVPWFWSDQYDIKLQIAGIFNGYDQQIISGSIKNEKFSIFSIKNDKLIAVESINKPKDFMMGKKLISKEAIINKEELAKDNIKLDKLIRK